MKTFFIGLFKDAMDIAGPPPCEYAVVAFGSFAKKLMTHYSDIEFCILIDEETEENKQYFRRLSYVLYASMISLGETILPALNIPYFNKTDFYDSTTPRGFSF